MSHLRAPWYVLFSLGISIGCGRQGVSTPDVEIRTAHRRPDHRTENVNIESTPKQPTKSDNRTAGTIAMAERLAQLARNADPEKNPSMSREKRIAELRKKIELETHLSQSIILRSHLAWQLMLDGQNEESVAEFSFLTNNLHLANLPPNHSFHGQFYELVGLANLRLAEQQNCIQQHCCDSCIAPISGNGLHQIRGPANEARKQFSRLLQAKPDDLRMRWLLNITHMVLGDYPDNVQNEFLIPLDAFESTYDVGRFVNVADSACVATLGLSGGVVTDDLDGDGLLDIMTSDWSLNGQLRFFHNNGDGSFRDDTNRAGLKGEVGGLNLIHADYDNDGHLDVFVLRGAWLGKYGEHPNSLLRNLGDGRFDDVTQSAGLLDYHPTQTAAWADFDLDGFLDLFIGNESRTRSPHPCQLFRNNGDGTFTDIAADVGCAHEGFVKGVTWGDFNNDGRPDLYLSCFGQPNVLLRNELDSNGNVRFTNLTLEANVADPRGSFATWAWDYDNDGWIDIMVASFSGFSFDGKSVKTVVSDYLGHQPDADRVHLFRNNRDGTFSNVAPQLGIDKPLLAMGANFGDLDNDGFLDCYFGTGDPHFSTIVPNRMFRNHNGKQFQDVTTSGGFGHIQKGHGIAFADLDNDGDQDVFAVMGGAIAGDVYQNALFENPGHGNDWITLRLQGTQSNRSAIGARIRIALKTGQKIYATVGSGGSFGSSSLQQEIGLGPNAVIERLDIKWPNRSGLHTFQNLKKNCSYVILEGARKAARRTQSAVRFTGNN